MSYRNYEHDIITKYKVKLIGWPPAVQFANPSEIRTVDNIRKLREALKVGDCKWIVQTRRQQQEHIEMLAARVAAGESVGKKRKQRSDKGKSRQKKDVRKDGKAGEIHRNDDTDSEDEEDTTQKTGEGSRWPLKKKRKTTTAARMLPPAIKSNEFIDDSDDDCEAASEN
jgi:hypothetical protein